jgi:DNA-binding XRE family transcriptional regulator
MKQICKRFKQVRIEAGLTQPEYAKKLKITRVSVNAIENFRYAPKIDTIRRMKKVFGKSYDWIIDGK